MPTAAERGRDVRQRLLAAATELIPELGWTAVSTRVLAQRAGVGPGLVHYYFSSLQALLREAAVETMRRSLGALGPVLAGADTPDAAVTMALGSLDAYSGTDPTSLLFVETYLASTRDEELRDELTALVTEVRADLAQALRTHGVPAPEQTAAVLAAAIDGVLLHRALDAGLTSSTVAPVLRRLVNYRKDG
ncbi:MAG: TetR/AcrR family transcriptional regulator [Streptosporangiales bacterium]